MVLKIFSSTFIISLLINSFLIDLAYGAPEAKSESSTSYDLAVKEFKGGRFESCNDILVKNFSSALERGEEKITALSAQCLIERKQTNEARKSAQNALKKKYSWWEGFEKNQKSPEGQALSDLKSLNRPAYKTTLHLIWIVGQSYGIEYSLTGTAEKRKRNKLKEKIDFFYSTLIETSYNAEKVEALNNNVSEKDDLLKKEVSRNGWSASLGYLRYSLKYVVQEAGYSGRGLGGGPTLSLGAFNENFFREYSYGLTLGRATSNFQLANSIDFIQSATVNIMGAYLQGIKKLSESGSGIGLNLQISYFGFTGKLPNGMAITATNTEVITSLIGRSGFYDFGYVDFKWGNSLRRGSTFWSIELGRHF